MVSAPCSPAGDRDATADVAGAELAAAVGAPGHARTVAATSARATLCSGASRSRFTVTPSGARGRSRAPRPRELRPLALRRAPRVVGVAREPGRASRPSRQERQRGRRRDRRGRRGPARAAPERAGFLKGEDEALDSGQPIPGVDGPPSSLDEVVVAPAAADREAERLGDELERRSRVVVEPPRASDPARTGRRTRRGTVARRRSAPGTRRRATPIVASARSARVRSFFTSKTRRGSWPASRAPRRRARRRARRARPEPLDVRGRHRDRRSSSAAAGTPRRRARGAGVELDQLGVDGRVREPIASTEELPVLAVPAPLGAA